MGLKYMYVQWSVLMSEYHIVIYISILISSFESGCVCLFWCHLPPPHTHIFLPSPSQPPHPHSCEDVIFTQCNKVHCTDNNHFRCKRVGYRCQCPSCDTATESAWCVRTKCLEQPLKPKCVFDSDSNKCRCPQCSDMTGTDPIWCRKVYCGPNNNTQCKWVL